MLVRCLYASRAKLPLTPSLLDGLLAQCRRNNPRRGVTGLLCFTSDTFVQVLEGGRDQVCDLLANILRDERHHSVRLLSYDEIIERRFGNWTMGQVSIASINPSLLLKYSEKAELDPFSGSGQAVMALLLELLATGAITARTG